MSNIYNIYNFIVLTYNAKIWKVITKRDINNLYIIVISHFNIGIVTQEVAIIIELIIVDKKFIDI